MTDVLVAVDGSTQSRAALRLAASLARMRGHRLRAIRMWTYPASAGAPFGSRSLAPADEMDHREREDLTAVLTEELGVDALGDIRLEVARGATGGVLVSRASEPSVGMVAVGARGLGGFERLVLGSTSQQLVENAPCPVMIVRGEVPAFGEWRTSRVVVGIDSSSGAAHALRWAGELARDLGAEVVMVHGFSGRVADREYQATTQRIEGEWSGPVRDLGVPFRYRLEEGDPRDALLEVADQEDAGVIVTGTRGSGPVMGVVLGSVAAHLARSSERPVVIVPPPRSGTRSG